MKIINLLVLALVAIGAPAITRSETVDVSSVSTSPVITVNDRCATLQASLYPNLYWTASVVDDMAWVKLHDSAIIQFVQLNRDSVIQSLMDFSGVTWQDTSLEIWLLRYYPSVGSADPFVLPLGGVRVGALSEAIPEGPVRQLQLIYLLAHRMLLQGMKPEAATYDLLSNHPLMQQTPLRRDNLAFLLALAVSERVLGSDSTSQAYQSPFWKRHLLGREVFDQYIFRKWTLSKERPLTRWLAEEVSDSRLVEVTDLAIDRNTGSSASRRQAIEGVSATGKLGFSVRFGSGGQLVIDKLDSTRTAYRSGLRTGDVVKTVDGKKPKNYKELVEFMLDQMESGGAMLAVTRNGKSETVFVRAGAGK